MTFLEPLPNSQLCVGDLYCYVAASKLFWYLVVPSDDAKIVSLFCLVRREMLFLRTSGELQPNHNLVYRDGKKVFGSNLLHQHTCHGI